MAALLTGETNYQFLKALAAALTDANTNSMANLDEFPQRRNACCYLDRIFEMRRCQSQALVFASLTPDIWHNKPSMCCRMGVVGGTFTMNGQLFTVVGIAPPAFFGDRLTDPAAFWIPIADEPLINGPMALVDFPQRDWLE